MSGFAIGLILGLLAGAGFGILASHRVQQAQAAARTAKEEAAALQAHCDRYHVGELEAVVASLATTPDPLPAQPESEIPFVLPGTGDAYLPGAAGPVVLGDPPKDRPEGLAIYPRKEQP